ncbi:hypothetical protein NQ317_003276 [Molorchus minor]|uniref:Sperm-associated antigen 1 n=1 Tax=Molorchus minor TaxID=1323400 RepID=A0ABQ9JM88_9CUCU|nr:hypothetical protein NQ317_003276 [Molorchus minor]
MMGMAENCKKLNSDVYKIVAHMFGRKDQLFYRNTISRYRISEIDYIQHCKDGKEMEKIYHVLLSGEEGVYPHLIEAAEERLRQLKPKSKWLRKTCPDLEGWVTNISRHNKELETRKNDETRSDTAVRIPKKLEDVPVRNREKRISSINYSAWDKYDPDTEILKMELAEEKEKMGVIEKQKRPKPKKSVSFNKYPTEAEAVYASNREKEKGNEFFKAGDYDEALQCYTNSISSKPCVNNLNNRAVTYLKLKQYELALEDCDRVLTIERDNVKAYTRKGEALEKLERYQEALDCAEFAVQKDPNNGVAQELAERVRKRCENKLTNTRMKIIEIE